MCMQIVTPVSIVNKNQPGLLHLNAKKQTQTLNSALILINVDHQLTAGMCLKLIVELMLRNACHFILKRRVQRWVGSQTIPLQT